jgi:hypothetical protein
VSSSWSDIWGVLRLFIIPFGGGIPAGVLHAKEVGMLWPLTAFLYFISDVILACVFEPLLLGLIAYGKQRQKMRQFGEAFSQSIKKSMAKLGYTTGPFALILFSFGADPMTGRTAALMAGHKFLTGWLFAITGDMVYFALIMASTLWLNGILGDGTLTIVIIIALMIIVPWLIRKTREHFQKPV